MYDSLVFIRMTSMNKLALVHWKERRVLYYTLGCTSHSRRKAAHFMSQKRAGKPTRTEEKTTHTDIRPTQTEALIRS